MPGRHHTSPVEADGSAVGPQREAVGLALWSREYLEPGGRGGHRRQRGGGEQGDGGKAEHGPS
ncbi:MAG: hypothetical protein IPI38_08565 [Gemmatimonadetes bacterium]|nr:hypothetical protein [Gemmatimonadota bacterium]